MTTIRLDKIKKVLDNFEKVEGTLQDFMQPIRPSKYTHKEYMEILEAAYHKDKISAFWSEGVNENLVYYIRF